MAESLTPEQTRILRHMLGIDHDRRKAESYRDYYCANPGDQKLLELERLGMVERYTPRAPTDYAWFTTTDAGRAAGMASQRAMFEARSPGSRRYSKWLEVRDALGDLTFGEYLTNPIYAESRRSA